MDAESTALFEESLQRFNREHYAPAHVVAREREGATDAHGRWNEIAGMGWFELLRDGEAASGGPAIEAIVPLMRAAGEGLWREPVCTVLGAGAVLALQADDAGWRETLLDGLASGTDPIAVAGHEAGDGWCRDHVRTIARRRDAGIVLDGIKLAVRGSTVSPHYAVLAADGDTGTAWYLVARDAPGLTLEHYAGADGRPLSTLRLEAVPARRLCAGEVTARAEAWSSILAAAESVGIMRGATADTAEYLRQRKQFGRPLLSFQVLQHRLVEMHMLARETDAVLHATACAYDAGSPDLARRVLVLRAQAAGALRHVTREAVQLHGGMGVTRELRIGHYYRRALMLDSLHGSEEWALERLAAA